MLLLEGCLHDEADGTWQRHASQPGRAAISRPVALRFPLVRFVFFTQQPHSMLSGDHRDFFTLRAALVANPDQRKR